MDLDASTVAQLWCARVAATPAELAFEHRVDGRWCRSTWKQCDERVRRIAGGLLALGVVRGDRVALLAGTRLEWVLCDFGALCAGATVTTIYPSSTPEECAYILGDSGARVVVVEDADQLAKIRAVRDRLPALEHVVVMAPPAPDGPGEQALQALQARGADHLEAHPDAFDVAVAGVVPRDLATLIYTSGTTGPPKGVMLSHDSWMYQAEAITSTVGTHMQDGDKQYLFLPLAHSFGKVCELIAVAVGSPTAIEGDVDVLLEGIQHTRPSLMAAVPRVFEKIYNRIVSRAQDAGGRRYAIFQWAVRVGDEAVRRELAGEPIGPWLAVQRRLAHRLVFRRLQAALGGNLRAFVSGGAPLSPDIARFFYAAGIRILEGYGMTETSAGAVANRFEAFRFGTVGQPFPGCQVRIADDGEILMRGRNLMVGYWNQPEATAEAIDAEGWLHSGDLGTLDAEGWLTISGRKKELIITAGGKNIGPARIENLVKARSPWVEEIVLHGDRRPFCVALVCIDAESVAGWADRVGLDGPRDHASLAGRTEVHDLVWADVAAVNAELPRHETIKRILLLERPLTSEAGELTPSMKVKRQVVETRFRDRLDAVYTGTLAQL